MEWEECTRGKEEEEWDNLAISEEEGGNAKRREVGGDCGDEGGGGKRRDRADRNDVRRGDGNETEKAFETLPLDQVKNQGKHVSETQVYSSQYYDRELKRTCLIREVPKYLLLLSCGLSARFVRDIGREEGQE